MSKSKTETLIEKMNAGTHRIRDGYVYRWVASRNEWVSEPIWRKDVIRRAEMAAQTQ